MTNCDQPLTTDRQINWSFAQHCESRSPQLPSHAVGAAPVVVIAQDRQAGFMPFQLAEQRLDPSLVPDAINDVAGDADDVRRAVFVDAFDEALIKGAFRGAVEVQVAEMQNRQAIPSCRQARQLQCPLNELHLEELIERHPCLPPMFAETERAITQIGGDVETLSDSMKMFRLGVEGGKPADGQVGAQPEWFTKVTARSLLPAVKPCACPILPSMVAKNQKSLGYM